MKPFIFGHWHCWQGEGNILLSNESIKRLRYFRCADDVVNALWLEGHKDAARALNKHVKGCQS